MTRAPESLSSASPVQDPAVLRRCACGGGVSALGECAACRRERRQKRAATMRRSHAGHASPDIAPPTVHATLGRAGESLSPSVRSDLESGFDHDFGHVHVHHDALAAQSAADVGARAYAVGHDVVFGAGQWAPSSANGHRLLAHELAHVVQHDAGGDRAAGTDIPVGPVDDPLESDADRMADHAVAPGESARSGAAHPVRRTAAPVLRREDGGRKDEEKKEPPLATSTPRVTGSKVSDDGGQQLSVGAIDVVIKPDLPGQADVKGGGTSAGIEVAPKEFNVDYTLDSAGRIATFKAPDQKVTVSIQTKYGAGISPAGKSVYGRGTTKEDIDAGNTSLKFHEGEHGVDFVNYLRTHPFPTFGGRKKMTLKAFSDEIAVYQDAIVAYSAAMDAAVLESGDCVGISIDAYNAGNADWKPQCAASRPPASKEAGE